MQTEVVNINVSKPLVKENQKPDLAMTQINDANHNYTYISNTNSEKKEIEKTDDYLLSSTITNKTKSKLNTIKRLPGYVSRGLSGDSDANFYEFMQISRIPYYLGGPGLVATILAGMNAFDLRANNAAKFNAKGMAAGCLMYYVMTAVAQKCVDIPVKLFRGIDLNHPFVHVVKTRPENAAGEGGSRLEEHNVFESCEFTRWDLLYNKDGKNPKEINAKYNEVAQKMGISDDANDTDSAIKPTIKELIKQSRAWKYIIAAFGVALGVGLGNQKAIKDEFCTGIFKSNPLSPIKNINTKVLRPLKDAFVTLWKGNSESKSSKIAGKFAILGFAASVIAANVSILKSTDKSKLNVVKVKEADS
jgi:hypothetical protein